MSDKYLLITESVPTTTTDQTKRPTLTSAATTPAVTSTPATTTTTTTTTKSTTTKPTPTNNGTFGSFLYFSYVAGLITVGYYLAYIYKDYINNFQYTPRQSFLHAAWIPYTAVTLYALTIFLLKKYMDTRPAIQFTGLKQLMFLHNGFLSAWSFVMLMKIMEQVLQSTLIPLYQSSNLTLDTVNESLFCDSNRAQATNNQLYFWYHVFYLSKYYELLDTVFICIKKKPLIFLHYYHHIVTLLLCWVTMDDYIAPQWICVSTNTLVHVFMYYYYMLQTVGESVWWKKHLTKLQIIQFIADEAGNSTFLVYTYLFGVACSGSWVGVVWGLFVITSFLFLFLQFYSNTYTKKPLSASSADKKVAAKNE